MSDKNLTKAMDEDIDQPPLKETAIAKYSGFSATPTTRGGAIILPKSVTESIQMANLMSAAKQAVPKAFRGEPGLCLSVLMQAMRWGMDPFAVIRESYVVNDVVAFQSKLLVAAINTSPALREPLDYEYEGEGDKRRVTVIGKFRSGVQRTITTPPIAQIKPKNSPLWGSDPDMQLGYYGARAWGRKHAPEILMGVLDYEEASSGFVDVTPVPGARSEPPPVDKVTFHPLRDDDEDGAPDSMDGEDETGGEEAAPAAEAVEGEGDAAEAAEAAVAAQEPADGAEETGPATAFQEEVETAAAAEDDHPVPSLSECLERIGKHGRNVKKINDAYAAFRRDQGHAWQRMSQDLHDQFERLRIAVLDGRTNVAKAIAAADHTGGEE